MATGLRWVWRSFLILFVLALAACGGSGGGGGGASPPAGTVALSGTIYHYTYSAGTYRVSAISITDVTLATATVPGSAAAAYSLAVPANSGFVIIEVFNDEDGDGMQGVSEPYGTYYAEVAAAAISGLDIYIYGTVPGAPDEQCIPSYTVTDPTGFSVVTFIPCHGATDVPANSPIVIFFSSAIDQATVDAGITVTGSSSGTITGTFYTSTADTYGNSFVAFAPASPYAAGETVTASIAVGTLQDLSGNTVDGAFSGSFTVTGTAAGSATSASLDFESSGGSLPAGVACLGDCGVLSAFGDAGPVGGYAAYITTAEYPPLVSANSAIGWTTSLLVVNGVPTGGADTLSFTYNFVSEEFNEYVDSDYDDILLVAVVGPSEQKVEKVTSINVLGLQTEPGTFPNMSDAYETGNRTYSTSIAGLGSPLTLVFIVSDVGDEVLPSAIMLDDIAFTTAAP